MIIHREPAHFPDCDRRVVFMSGLSDPSVCSLSRSQRELMNRLCIDDECKLYRNFPYVGPVASQDCDSEPLKEVPLVRASLANTKQFLLCRGQRYLKPAGQHWDRLLRATKSIVVITLSCGLEIFNRLMARRECSRAAVDSRVYVIALGPVAWRTPVVRHTIIQGERDYLSRCFFRATQRVPRLGHMDYASDIRVIDQINEVLCSNIFK